MSDDAEALAPLTWLEWRILRQAAMKWAEQVKHGEPGPEPFLGEVKSILAAHVAAARAEERERWAGEVRALADEWEHVADSLAETFPEGESVRADARIAHYRFLARELRALLPENREKRSSS